MEEEQTTQHLTGTEEADLNHKQSSSSGPPKWRSCRFLLAYLILAGNAAIFFQRVSFSMAVVCMVNHTALRLLDHSLGPPHSQDLGSTSPSSPILLQDSTRNGSASMIYGFTKSDSGHHHQPGTTRIPTWADANETVLTPSEDEDGASCSRKGSNQTDPSKGAEDGPFVWSKQTQGLLLGAVYWGYMTFQVLGGYLFYRWGPRAVTAVSMLLMSLLTILCHPAALWSPWAVFVLRVAIGITTSFAIPSMAGIWGRWAPSGERATLLSLSFSGQNVANSLVFPTAALLCKYGFGGGWPSVFYVYGLLGVVWCVGWVVLVADTPESSGRISAEEKHYILSTRSQVTDRSKMSVPWCRIFTSSAFWAIVAAQVSFTWGLFLFMSNLPLYMYEVMNFDIKSNGFYSMLPYVALFMVQLTGGFIADFVVRRNIMSTFLARRFFMALSSLVPACCLLVMSYLDCRQVAAVVSLLVLSTGFSGFAFSGFMVNMFEIAPRYATTIVSVSNSFACLPGIVTPYLVAELTPDQSREQWQVIFFLTGGVYVAGTLVFCTLASTSVQPWAVDHTPDVLLTGVNGSGPPTLQDTVKDGRSGDACPSSPPSPSLSSSPSSSSHPQGPPLKSDMPGDSRTLDSAENARGHDQEESSLLGAGELHSETMA